MLLLPEPLQQKLVVHYQNNLTVQEIVTVLQESATLDESCARPESQFQLIELADVCWYTFPLSQNNTGQEV